MIEIKNDHPDITDEMWKNIEGIIAEYKNIPGSVIPVLRLCQEVVGYLPVDLLDSIATGMDLPKSEVFGVATFYHFFSLKPKGRHSVKVCTGTACYVKGIQSVVDRICDHHSIEEEGTTEDRRYSLNTIRCLGACGLAPVMVINDDVYGDVKADSVLKIMEKYE